MQYQQKMGLFDKTGNGVQYLKDPNDNKVIDLASGFSTYHNNDFMLTEKNDSQVDAARALTLSKTIAQETENLSYNFEATTLFQLYYNNYSLLKDFEFREEVFKSLLNNFGFSKGLYHLVDAQRFNNFITPSHVSYLKETLDLLSGFIPARQVSNESWSSLLYHDVGDFSKGKSDIKKLLSNNSYKILQLHNHEIVPIWLNARNGMEDLIWFNKLVWGRPLPGRIQ